MIKNIAFAAGAAGLALSATAATAQMANQATPAPQMAPATNVSDAEITSFAQIVIGMQMMRQQGESMGPQQQQAAVLALLEENNLEPQRFAQIAQTSQQDETLRTRIQERVQAIVQQG